MNASSENKLDHLRAHVAEHGTFCLLLTPYPTFDKRYRRDGAMLVHEEVLRPLLRAASECFAYGIRTDSPIYEGSASLFKKDGRRYRVDLSGDPITGHELFWNSSGGARGSVVILVRESDFVAEEIFPGCCEAKVVSNFRSADTPSAISMARDRVSKDSVLAFCLSRTNGIQWMSIFAKPTLALPLYEKAVVLCKPFKSWHLPKQVIVS